MFIIADEDIGKVKVTVCNVLSAVASGDYGANKFYELVEFGDEFHPIVVTGYWVGDIIRIDIKVKRNE